MAETPSPGKPRNRPLTGLQSPLTLPRLWGAGAQYGGSPPCVPTSLGRFHRPCTPKLQLRGYWRNTPARRGPPARASCGVRGRSVSPPGPTTAPRRTRGRGAGGGHIPDPTAAGEAPGPPPERKTIWPVSPTSAFPLLGPRSPGRPHLVSPAPLSGWGRRRGAPTAGNSAQPPTPAPTRPGPPAQLPTTTAAPRFSAQGRKSGSLELLWAQDLGPPFP